MAVEYVEFDDVLVADEQVIRAHAAELIAMAGGHGLTNSRYPSRNRRMASLTEKVEPLGEFRPSERQFPVGVSLSDIHREHCQLTGNQCGPYCLDAVVGVIMGQVIHTTVGGTQTTLDRLVAG